MKNNPLYRVVPVASLLFLSLGSRPASAGWPLNGAPVCTEPGDHTAPQAVSDGQGGIIMVWEDTRGGEPDIYVQRLDGYGNEMWTPGGVQISSQNAQEGQPQLASDGAGGAIIVWRHTNSDWDIRVQRVDAAGNVLWQDNGISICGLIGAQHKPRVIPDGAGGAIIVWEDMRLGNWDLYAQRVDASGARLWTPDGADVCIQTSDQFEPRMALDATGGVFFVWEDTRNTFQRDIYLQHFTAGGFPYLTTDGVPVCANGANQRGPQIVSLDIGGVVVVWQDDRTGLATPTTFAQRVYASGAMAWTANGIQVCTFGALESGAELVNDNDHGVIVCWQDNRALGDVYAQRLDALGTRLWAATGVSLTGAGQQFNPHMTSDGNGGAIVSWKDIRYNPDGDIYAARIDVNGALPGTPGGTALTSLPGLRIEAPIVSDGAGGGIMAWADLRTSSSHVYAQRLERFDNWGYPSAEIVSVKDVPGDQGGQVNVAWNASRLDPWPSQTIDRYTVWRSIDAALATALLKSGASPRLSAGAIDRGVNDGIRVETTATGTAYWQLVGTVDAFHLASYALAAPTLFDSTATSAGLHTFQVIAHHDFGNEYWISNTASGHSIDNLAPAAPLMLTAQRVGSDVLLHWNPSGENETDFSAYAIYRASSAGVQPLPGLFVTDSIDTLVTDTNPPAGFLYYIVTARDTHGNQSAPSNEAAVTIPTGIGDRTPAITRLTLDANFPNPFSAGTDLRVGLPRASDVRVEVYDVAGRRVAQRNTARLEPGWQSITFNGRDARGERLPSGVYFYRITAAGETRTSKMVIGR